LTPPVDGGAQGAAWTPPAWEDVVREHGDRVYRLAYRLSGNSHDAEDITQETFIRVFRSLAGYRPGSFEGWLHRITTNVFLDMVRRRQRIRMEALPDESDRIAGREPSPEQVFHDTNLDPDLQAALDELLPEFRAAVVLCDVEGLSYEEIGATLGVKIGTVRSRIHRGRQALRAGLERRRAERALAEGVGPAREPGIASGSGASEARAWQ
jgi:RNA polymerase sigma-70 factor (ECF subfamily)